MISWQVYIFGDRCTDDITPNKILVCSHIKQIDSTLQWVCTVVDRRWCQNVVVRASLTNLAPPQVPLFLFLPHLMLSVIFYWTDSQQHGIFLLISKVLQSLGLGSNKLFPLPKDLDSSRYATNLRKHVAFFKKHVSTVLQSSSILIYTKYKVEFKVYNKMLIGQNKQ